MPHRNRDGEHIGERDGADETEDYDGAVLAELLQAVRVFIVHIAEVGDRDGCERESAQVEHGGKRHDDIHRDVLLLDEQQHRRDHEREQERGECVAHAAHHERHGKHRIRRRNDDGELVARVLPAVEIDHRNDSHIREHAHHADEHGDAVRGEVLPHRAHYGEDIHSAGRHDGDVDVGEVGRICVDVVDAVGGEPSRKLHSRIHLAAETVHGKQEDEADKECAQHQHARDEEAVGPPLAVHGSCARLAFALARSVRGSGSVKGSAVKVDKDVRLGIRLLDEDVGAHRDSRGRKRQKYDKKDAGKIAVVSCDLRHPEVVHSVALGDGGGVDAHHGDVVEISFAGHGLVLRTDGERESEIVRVEGTDVEVQRHPVVGGGALRHEEIVGVLEESDVDAVIGVGHPGKGGHAHVNGDVIDRLSVHFNALREIDPAVFPARGEDDITVAVLFVEVAVGGDGLPSVRRVDVLIPHAADGPAVEQDAVVRALVARKISVHGKLGVECGASVVARRKRK